MFVQERLTRILATLKGQPRLSVTDLQERLGLSRSTLRRDLVELERRGEILRVHGGVVLRGYLQGEPTFERRRTEAAEAKARIGRAAARLAPENATVFVDAGTTCLLVARELLVRDDLRIFTHSTSILAEAAGAAATVVCLGGEYRQASQALVGGFAMRWLEELRFEVAFIAASGLSADGLSTTELTEADVKRRVVASADQVVLAADSTKWARPSAVRFAGWNSIDSWVTDEAPPRAASKRLAGAGVRIVNATEEVMA